MERGMSGVGNMRGDTQTGVASGVRRGYGDMQCRMHIGTHDRMRARNMRMGHRHNQLGVTSRVRGQPRMHLHSFSKRSQGRGKRQGGREKRRREANKL
jgi:hypothetical protein